MFGDRKGVRQHETVTGDKGVRRFSGGELRRAHFSSPGPPARLPRWGGVGWSGVEAVLAL